MSNNEVQNLLICRLHKSSELSVVERSVLVGSLNYWDRVCHKLFVRGDSCVCLGMIAMSLLALISVQRGFAFVSHFSDDSVYSEKELRAFEGSVIGEL